MDKICIKEKNNNIIHIKENDNDKIHIKERKKCEIKSNIAQIVPIEYTLPIASPTMLGGVKIGSGISELSDGTISVSERDPVFIANTEFSAESDDVILRGQPVFLKNNGHVGLAQANSSYTAEVVGFAVNDTLVSFSCTYSKNPVVLSDWTNISGNTLLNTNSDYFLSYDSPGTITNVVPTKGYSVFMGEALNTTTLQVEIEDPYLL